LNLFVDVVILEGDINVIISEGDPYKIKQKCSLVKRSSSLSKKQFRKSVESLRYQIARHHQKIANEQQKESPDLNLIKY
jgi:hypothetical protein